MTFSRRYRPMLVILRDALYTLEMEPGPMTPEKAELMRYLRERIMAQVDVTSLKTT